MVLSTLIPLPWKHPYLVQMHLCNYICILLENVQFLFSIFPALNLQLCYSITSDKSRISHKRQIYLWEGRCFPGAHTEIHLRSLPDSIGYYVMEAVIIINLDTGFRYYVSRKPGGFLLMIWQAGEWGYSWKYSGGILQLSHYFLSGTTTSRICTMTLNSEVTHPGEQHILSINKISWNIIVLLSFDQIILLSKRDVMNTRL